MEITGIVLITLTDNSKWILDLDNNMFDNYKWYKSMGTLESELTEEIKKDFLKDGKTLKKIK